jgi:hypothetical protein
MDKGSPDSARHRDNERIARGAEAASFRTPQ